MFAITIASSSDMHKKMKLSIQVSANVTSLLSLFQHTMTQLILTSLRPVAGFHRRGFGDIKCL